MTRQIIARAGFQQKANWGFQRQPVPPKHELRFVEAMEGVLQGAFHKAILPNVRAHRKYSSGEELTYNDAVGDAADRAHATSGDRLP